MLFDEDMSVEQAAARLNVDPQTIRSEKHKALTRLREAMFGEQTSEPSSACGSGPRTAGIAFVRLEPPLPPRKTAEKPTTTAETGMKSEHRPLYQDDNTP